MCAVRWRGIRAGGVPLKNQVSSWNSFQASLHMREITLDPRASGPRSFADLSTTNGDSAMQSAAHISIPKKLRHVPLARLLMSVRLRNVLDKMGCERLGDLHGLAFEQVLMCRNCGQKTLTELKELVDNLPCVRELPPIAVPSGSDKAAPPEAERMPTRIFIPQSARGWHVTHLPMSVRLANILHRVGACLLGDLHGIEYERIKAEKNSGRKTVAELFALVRRVQAGEFEKDGTSEDKQGLSGLIRLLDEAVEKLSPREQDMLLQRIGADGGEPLTLEEIADKYALTRERVRQIVAKILKQTLRSGGPVMHDILRDLAARCAANVCPLTPELFAEWHRQEESSASRFPVPFYLRLIAELVPEIPTWPEGQQTLRKTVGRVPEVLRHLRGLLQGREASPLPLSEAFEHLVHRFAGLTVNEFLDALRRDESLVVELSAPDRFTVRPARLRRHEWVRLVLLQAERPLTPEEIIERARHLLGESFSPPTPFSLANTLTPNLGFYLLDRHAYGLRRHFRLPLDLWFQVRADFHLLLREESRPVSTAEVINGARFDWAGETNAPELAQVLREDDRFIDLGRFLFALAEWGIEEREYVRDLIPKVLAEKGRPMTGREIGRELQRLRSVTPTSMSEILRKTPGVRDYGFGFYGLESWEGKIKESLVTQALLVNRVVMRSEPPLTFGRLCQILDIPLVGRLADLLWHTVRSLSKVKIQSAEMSPDVLLSHQRWNLGRALRVVLEASDRPLPLYEIQWAVNDRYGFAFGDKSSAEIERHLQQSDLFIRNARGEYLLDRHLAHYELDVAHIRQSCFDALSAANEIISTDDLLARIEAAGVKAPHLSAHMLAALLRGDETFEEIGNNLFRVRR